MNHHEYIGALLNQIDRTAMGWCRELELVRIGDSRKGYKHHEWWEVFVAMANGFVLEAELREKGVYERSNGGTP